MPDCNLEHERDVGKDEAGYRCGARYVHCAGAMVCKSEAKKEKRKAGMGRCAG